MSSHEIRYLADFTSEAGTYHFVAVAKVQEQREQPWESYQHIR